MDRSERAGPARMTFSELPLADPRKFRQRIDGSKVDLYTLVSPQLVAQITNFGGRVVNLFVPDRHGGAGNVVLGFETLEEYRTAKERYYGAIIGRYANRIAGGRLVLDGRSVQLEQNDGENHLHGGREGFHRVVWDVAYADSCTLALTHVSRDGEQGYPGEMHVNVTYTLVDAGSDRPGVAGMLRVQYEATTAAATIVNLTNHAYFNLGGAGSGSVAGHVLEIAADHYTPIDGGLIPTGEIAQVAGTPFDFRSPAPIGSRLDIDHEQLQLGRGYDHNFVLRGTEKEDRGAESRPTGGGLRFAARVSEPVSGRTLELATTEPGLQLYGGNFFDGSDVGASGRAHGYRECFALEPQHFPDSPNRPAFPSVFLRPGDQYLSQSLYTFLLADE